MACPSQHQVFYVLLEPAPHVHQPRAFTLCCPEQLFPVCLWRMRQQNNAYVTETWVIISQLFQISFLRCSSQPFVDEKSKNFHFHSQVTFFFFPNYILVCLFLLSAFPPYFFNAVSAFFPLACLTLESLQFCILQGIFLHTFLSVTLFHISSVVTVISGMIQYHVQFSVMSSNLCSY